MIKKKIWFYQCWSNKNKWLPPIKFKPTPPAFKDTSITWKKRNYFWDHLGDQMIQRYVQEGPIWIFHFVWTFQVKQNEFIQKKKTNYLWINFTIESFHDICSFLCIHTKIKIKNRGKIRNYIISKFSRVYNKKMKIQGFQNPVNAIVYKFGCYNHIL